jgi:hypothetical protein
MATPIGYWDGDTLVADTIGFNDKSSLQSTMVPHTEEAHLIQRFRRRGSAHAYFGLHLQPLLQEGSRGYGGAGLQRRSANLAGLEK